MHVVANHHASYYPGAQTLVVKLVYEVGSGRVLGVQAVGGAGVDKRLDVVATLLHFRGTIHDLAELDLAYAPPFGAAKDPLHMAAFVAQNDLDGLARVIQPDADLSAYQVVDVRDAREVRSLPIAGAPHAIHIPLNSLRDRLAELDPEQPTVVACRSGHALVPGHAHPGSARLPGGLQPLRRGGHARLRAQPPAPGRPGHGHRPARPGRHHDRLTWLDRRSAPTTQRRRPVGQTTTTWRPPT